MNKARRKNIANAYEVIKTAVDVLNKVLEEECAEILSKFFLSLRERNKLRKMAKNENN